MSDRLYVIRFPDYGPSYVAPACFEGREDDIGIRESPAEARKFTTPADALCVIEAEYFFAEVCPYDPATGAVGAPIEPEGAGMGR